MAVIICARYNGLPQALTAHSGIHGRAPLGARSLNACDFGQPESPDPQWVGPTERRAIKTLACYLFNSYIRPFLLGKRLI
jgi:hypothetical protein